MKVKVIDELSRKRDVSVEKVKKAEEGLAVEAKQLLLGASIAERQVLTNAGLDGNIKKHEDAKGINLERERFEGTYGEKVFTEDEVRDICQQYALKLLPSKYYKGGIDPVLGAKIVEFFKKNNIDSGNYEAANNLYIMAPPSAFRLAKKVDPFRVQLDPVLFYRIGRRNDTPMYVPVHQWGNDFTVFRRLIGAVKYNFWTNAVFGTAYKAVILLMIFAMFKINVYNPRPVMIALPIAFLWHLLVYIEMYGGSNGEKPISGSEHKFSQHGWNKEF
jgi:hypothetical protein